MPASESLAASLSALRSRIARRILLLFAGLAMLPLIALSVLGTQELNSLLGRQALQALEDNSRSFSLNFFTWLKEQEKHFRLHSELKNSADMQRERWLNGAFSQLSELEPLDDEQSWRDEHGDIVRIGPQSLEHLRGGNTVLLSDRDGALPRVRLAHLRKDGSRRLRLAQLHNDQILELLQSSQSKGEILCIANQEGALLNCSDDKPSTRTALGFARTQAARSADRQFSLKIAERDYIGVHRELFTRARFGVGNWQIYLLRSTDDIYQSAHEFSWFFAKVSAATMLLALLASVAQIRKYLEPVQKLTEGTRRIAQQDYRARVDVNSGDELQALGEAFNQMGEHLQHQFSTFDYLSRLGELSLARADQASLCRVATEGVCQSLPAVFALTLSKARQADRAPEVVLYDAGQGQHLPHEIAPLNRGAWKVLAGMNDIVELPARKLDGPWATLADYPIDSLLLANVSADASQPSILAAGLRHTGDGADKGRLLQFRSFSDRLRAALSNQAQRQKLHRMAYRDDLTGLFNKHSMAVHVQKLLPELLRRGQRGALLLVDLDRFKQINDNLGHNRGDNLLREAARRLRATTPPHVALSRFGGDEFTVFLPGCKTGPESCSVKLAGMIAEAMAEPFQLGDHTRHLSASIGIAEFPDDATSYEDLLKAADTAMYEAKRHTGKIYHRFDARAAKRIHRTSELEHELRNALDQNQLYSLFQPKVSISSGLPIGAEVLMRWEHPKLGFVPPDEFIPLAEESGLIVPVGRVMQTHACTLFANLLRELPRPLQLSVNASPVQLAQADFVEQTLRDLELSGLEPAQLELEVTESAMMLDADDLLKKLHKLRDAGVQIAIDDFGTGYSSLAYLHQLPATTLKVDQSFIRRIGRHGENAELATAIISMGHSLGLEIVAEGVETERQLKLLDSLGCDIAQGYFFSRPLTLDDYGEYVRNAQPLQHLQGGRL